MARCLFLFLGLLMMASFSLGFPKNRKPTNLDRPQECSLDKEALESLLSCLRSPEIATRTNAWSFVANLLRDKKQAARLGPSQWKLLSILCQDQRNPNCLSLVLIPQFKDALNPIQNFVLEMDEAKAQSRKGFYTSVTAGEMFFELLKGGQPPGSTSFPFKLGFYDRCKSSGMNSLCHAQLLQFAESIINRAPPIVEEFMYLKTLLLKHPDLAANADIQAALNSCEQEAPKQKKQLCHLAKEGLW